MPVTSFTSGDLFTVEIVKSLDTNPNLEWRNTYEWQAVDDGVTSNLVDAGLQMVAFEQLFHNNVVNFIELRISTWEPDSVPYDPTAFLALPLSGTGLLDPSDQDVMALNVCLDMVRIPVSGRFGHIYYRGALLESDVEAPAGDNILTDPSVFDTRYSTAVASSGMDDILAGDGFVAMVMISKDGSVVRRVFGLSPQGVVTLPTKHKWFNRTPTP
jgi:hypothetical protein